MVDGFLEIKLSDQMFKTIDTDKSGKLSMKELKEGLKRVHPVLDTFLTQEIHNRAIRKVTPASEIDINEFRSYIVYIYNYIDFFT